MSQEVTQLDFDVLNRISAFVLNRESQDFRLELYEYLIMIALRAENSAKALNKQRIIASIEEDLKVENLPDTQIDSALEELVKNRKIMKIRDKNENQYYLSEDEKNRIDLLKNEQMETTNEVKNQLIQRIRQKEFPLSSMQEELVFPTFRAFLSQTLSSLGSECCFSLISSQGTNIDSIKHVSVKKILQRVLKKSNDAELAAVEYEVFQEYITDPDESLSNYVYSLAQSYFLVQVLHVDPDCQKITSESLKKTKVYLDTNVLYSSIDGNSKKINTANKVLELTSKLGITTVISKRTKKEFLTLLQYKRKSLNKEISIPQKRFEKTQDHLEEGLLKSFLEKKASNPNLSFKNYVDRLEEIVTITQNRYGTIFDDNSYAEILEDEQFSTLKNIVVEVGNACYLDKSDPVAEHDAFHLLLIQELRKADQGGITGPRYWFLTFDRSLTGVEQKFDQYDGMPSSVYVNSWIQIISPLLAPTQTKDAKATYMSLFASRLPLAGGCIDEDVYLNFQGQWMDDDDLSSNDVARIVGNRHIKEFYEKAKTSTQSLSDEEKETMMKSVVAIYKNQKKETREVKQEVLALKQSSEKMQNEIKQLKSLSKTQESYLAKLGHVLGGLLWLILWYFLYEYFTSIHSVEHSVALLSAMIIAATVGALADLKGYRWLLDRLLRHKSEQKE